MGGHIEQAMYEHNPDHYTEMDDIQVDLLTMANFSYYQGSDVHIRRK